MASAKLSSFPPGETAAGGANEPPPSIAPLSGRSAGELLAALGRLTDRLASFELGDEASSPAAASAAASTLAQELSLSLQLLRALERLNNTGGNEDVSFEDMDEPETRPRLVLTQRQTPTIGDLCFAGTFELTRARQRLLRVQDVEATLDAVETGLRKLRRVIMAVLETAEAEGTARIGSAEHLRRHRAAGTRAALEVRRLYAEFRRGLRRAAGEDSEAVLSALRYSAGALAVLVASTAYGQARASDRALLRRLRERMIGWSRSGRDVPLGLQLLDDVWTCADLLRGVNGRQELRAHDTATIDALLAASDRSSPGFAEQLLSLSGLDDELDVSIGEWRRSPSTTVEQRLLAQLEQLRLVR